MNSDSSKEERRLFTVHNREYWWTKSEMVYELGLDPSEAEEVWESGGREDEH